MEDLKSQYIGSREMLKNAKACRKHRHVSGLVWGINTVTKGIILKPYRTVVCIYLGRNKTLEDIGQ